MPLINLVVTLIVVGVLLWAVNTYIPMDRRIKQILNIVIVIAVVLWLLPQGSPHLLLCYAWQTLWHEAGTYLAHLRPRKTA